MQYSWFHNLYDLCREVASINADLRAHRVFRHALKQEESRVTLVASLAHHILPSPDFLRQPIKLRTTGLYPRPETGGILIAEELLFKMTEFALSRHIIAQTTVVFAMTLPPFLWPVSPPEQVGSRAFCV